MSEPFVEGEREQSTQTNTRGGDSIEQREEAAERFSPAEQRYTSQAHNALEGAMVSESVSDDSGVMGETSDRIDPEHTSKAAETTTTTSGREYTCLECGTSSDSFLHECDHCGGTSFRTGSDGPANEPGLAEKIFTEFARITAPFNPYIPR